MRAALASVLLSVSLVACSGGGSNTRIVVVVGSDYAVPAELDAISLQATGTGKPLTKTLPLTAAISLPLAVDLVPSDNQAEPLAVRVTGLRGNLPLVTQEARLQFLPGESRVLSLFLGRACAGVACDANHTCAAGRCNQPVDVAPSTLPMYDPNHLPIPSAPDGGAATVDGAPADVQRGGLDGAIRLDGSAIDGALDATIKDASLDQPLPPPADAEPVRHDSGSTQVPGTGGGVSSGTGGSGGGGGVRGSGGAGGVGGASGTGGRDGGTPSTGPVVLVGGLVTVSNAELSSGGVRLVDHGLERTPTVCGQVNGKTVCLSGGIRP